MRLQNEVRDYKRRLSSSGAGMRPTSPSQGNLSTYRNTPTQSANPFEFSFGSNASFDTFASLPTQADQNGDNGNFSNPMTTVKKEPSSRSNSNGQSPREGSRNTNDHSASMQSQQGRSPTSRLGDSSTPNLFNLGSTAYGFPQFGSPGPVQVSDSPLHRSGSRSASEQAPSLYSNGDSPSMGSVSQHGPGSSCGASPEPHGQPGNNTFANGEAGKDAFGDLSDFEFNPDNMLFGGYRESQDAIFGGGDFSGGLYDDWLAVPGDDAAFDIAQNSLSKAPSQNAGSLMDFVEQQREGGDDHEISFDPSSFSAQKEKREILTCHKIWSVSILSLDSLRELTLSRQRLQNCPKFEKGEIDIDNLCGELQKKATCTESGASIDRQEWENALWRIAGIPQEDQRKHTEKGGASGP